MKHNSFWQSCLNWKFIIPAAVIALVVWYLFRDQFNLSALFPFLFLLLCPLSMVVMMKSMGGHSNCSEDHHNTAKKTNPSTETIK